MKKVEDIKKEKFIVIMGSKDEVMAKLGELAREEKNENEKARMIEDMNDVWEAMDFEEKRHTLKRYGF